jgi:CheY-like chemotaxis protein
MKRRGSPCDEPGEPSEERNPAMSTQGKRILAIDNDEEVLMDLDLFLTERGYHTSTAIGSGEGIQLLQSGVFDLVLLDDYLPNVDCVEMIKQIQVLQPGCPIIVMQPTSPHPRESEQVRALGAADLVSKRSHGEILERIQQYLMSEGTDAKSIEVKR